MVSFLTEFEEDTESEVSELRAGEGEAADPRAAAADAGEAGHEAAHPRRAHLVLLEADLLTQQYTINCTQYTTIQVQYKYCITCSCVAAVSRVAARSWCGQHCTSPSTTSPGHADRSSAT